MKRLPLVFLTLIIFWFSTLASAGIKDKLGVGVTINAQRLYGDSFTGTFEYGGYPISLRLNFKPTMFVDMDLGFSKSSVDYGPATLKTDMINLGFKFGYRFFNYKKFNPLLFVGVGAINFEHLSGSRVNDGYGSIGAGVEYFINRQLGLNFNTDYRLTSGDDFDGANLGSSTDAFLNVGFGLNYYMGGRRTQFDEVNDNWVPEDYSAVEQIPPQNGSVAEMRLSSEEYANLTFKRNQLLNSIAQRDKDIKLLRAKVNVLNEQSEELTEKLHLAGLMGAENGTETESTYLVYYRNALVLYQAEYYENALAILKGLINDDPYNALTASCWYWVGECQFKMNEFQGAAVSFKRSAAMQSNIRKANMAQLMMGLSHLKLGDETAARICFEKLLSNDLNNSFTELAKDYLSELSLN